MLFMSIPYTNYTFHSIQMSGSSHVCLWETYLQTWWWKYSDVRVYTVSPDTFNVLWIWNILIWNMYTSFYFTKTVELKFIPCSTFSTFTTHWCHLKHWTVCFIHVMCYFRILYCVYLILFLFSWSLTVSNLNIENREIFGWNKPWKIIFSISCDSNSNLICNCCQNDVQTLATVNMRF